MNSFNMKAFVVFASCLTVVSSGSSSFGGFGGNSGGTGGGYSGSSSSSDNSGSIGGYTRGGSSSNGVRNSFGGNNNSFGGNNNGLSALMSLMGVGGGFGGNNQQKNNGFATSGFGNVVGGGNAVGGTGASSGSSPSGQQRGQVRRFVSVHVAPEEDTPREPRIIRAGGPQDTHVNIIFVKAPSGSSEQQTEVILPEPPKQKTLVYVLLRKPVEGQENVKIRAPNPTKPPKPEVYFIRYKSDGPGNASGANAGDSGFSSGGSSLDGANSGGFGNTGFSGFSSGANDAPSSSYGAPSQQNTGGSNSGSGYQ